MASKAQLLLDAVWARLAASPALEVNELKRSHRTTVTRENAPAVHLVAGPDVPEPSRNDCRTNRAKGFTVRVFYRDDDGAAAADDLVVEIHRRLDPSEASGFAPYPEGVSLRQGRIDVAEEIADEDAVAIEMEYAADYTTEGWTLE